MLSLHIGYPKTGTTFLQEHLFPKLVGIDYRGRHYLEGVPRKDESLQWTFDLVFSPEWKLPEGVGDLRQSLVSSEVFIRPYYGYRTLLRIKELAQLVGGVRIIISIRNQVDLIMSRYLHDRSVHKFPEYSLRNALDFEGLTQCKYPVCLRRTRFFASRCCDCLERNLKIINMRHYDFLAFYTQTASLFGAQNILLIVSEKLKLALNEEAGKITDFLEVEAINPRYLYELSSVRSNVSSDRGVPKSDEQLGCSLRDEIFNYFSVSNKILERELGLGLSGLGYFD